MHAMKVADYKRLETYLNAAEALFEGELVPENQILEIRIELQDLIAKVSAERMRAEALESVSASNAPAAAQSIGQMIALEHIKGSSGHPFENRAR